LDKSSSYLCGACGVYTWSRSRFCVKIKSSVILILHLPSGRIVSTSTAFGGRSEV
jgi:hypothetical protein